MGALSLFLPLPHDYNSISSAYRTATTLKDLFTVLEGSFIIHSGLQHRLDYVRYNRCRILN